MRRKTHELQWLEILFNRSGLNEKEVEQYQRLLRGFEGEVEFDKVFHLIFGERIRYIDDLTLRFKQQTAQLDKVVCVNNTLYVIDMKNYRGHYTYEDGTWKAGQSNLSHNILEQLRRAVRIVENVLFEANIKINVQGVLVFMNPESTVEIKDPVKEQTLMYTEIFNWLLELKNSKSHSVESEKWTKVLNTFATNAYKTKKTCSQERFEQLQKGIMCTKCAEFDIQEQKNIIICNSCDHIEVKETAYVRTICEYGLLMHDTDIQKEDVRKFLKKKSKDRYLKIILNKHFKLKKIANKYSRYENKGVMFDSWFEHNEDYFKKIEVRKQWK